ncbi:hypothetical protein REH65_31275 [Saccharopolyspora sp. ID03-671]|uniref:hypothetical protein n=1 Tax=Saccharopolyspora sp. ID03-671 TaxID=3073066 RepID=UPI0032506C69
MRFWKKKPRAEQPLPELRSKRSRDAYANALNYLGTETVRDGNLDQLLILSTSPNRAHVMLIANEITLGLRRIIRTRKPIMPTQPSGWFGRWTRQDLDAAHAAGAAEGYRKATGEFTDGLGELILVPLLEKPGEPRDE